MNYLAHIFLSPSDPEQQLGSLIADFTRGRLETLAQHYSPGIVQGIALHRKIDSYTDMNPWVIQSKVQFSPGYRRFSGIILDILHDHFLSLHWAQYSSDNRQAFIQDFYQLLLREKERLPPRLSQLAPRMVSEDWLGSYADMAVIEMVYQRMSNRLQRTNPLASASHEVRRLYPQLIQDFRHFFPELIRFSQQQQESLDRT